MSQEGDKEKPVIAARERGEWPSKIHDFAE